MSGVGCFVNKMVEMVLACNEKYCMYCHLQGGNGSYLVLSDIECFGSIETVEKVLPCNEWHWMFWHQNGQNGFTL